MKARRKLALLVGGGPAPGINGVLEAAVGRAALDGVDALGIEDGFEWLMAGRLDRVRPLTPASIEGIRFRGGSSIGISRANPTRDAAHLEATVSALLRLNVSWLVTIGGDDTAFSALKVEERSAGRIRVAHVPKTIDNDLYLPGHIDTFGYQTARHVGVEIVKNLMVDAVTTSRWYLAITMGRHTGHLALGIGKAAGATLTLLPEELAGPGRFDRLVDTIAGAAIKRLSDGRRDGVAVIAEGVVQALERRDLPELERVERDAHGNLRIAEVDLGEVLRAALRRRLEQLGVRATIVAKNIGYELRCADPIAFDLEYTRELGHGAADYLLAGGNAAMVSMQEGRLVPIPFARLLDPESGRARVRPVDLGSTGYAIARRHMVRLEREDLEDPHELARLAATVGMTGEALRRELGHVALDAPAAEAEAADLVAAAIA